MKPGLGGQYPIIFNLPKTRKEKTEGISLLFYCLSETISKLNLIFGEMNQVVPQVMFYSIGRSFCPVAYIQF